MAGTFDSLGLARSLRTRMVEVASSDLHLKDRELHAAAREIWSEPASGLVGELWVEGVLPPKPGESLQALADAALFDQHLLNHLRDSGAWGDWDLYEHQERAVKEAAADPSGAVLVSAGTGAGKTESFLLPLVDRLWRTQRRGAGIRALILYPMNALVRDQMDRLDKWLGGQSRLTYFHFTSETPESERIADQLGIPNQNPNRIRSRDAARMAPPDICVTNYSMLEYMLARPQDAPFFGTGLEVVVLDEAHLYAGTLASEIMFLLRRAMVRCGLQASEVLHLATSATLGGNDEELAAFLADLTSTSIAHTHIVRGEFQDSQPFTTTAAELTADELTALDASLDASSRKRIGAEDVLQLFDGSCSELEEAPLRLGTRLMEWPAMERLRASILVEAGVPRRLTELSAQVFGKSSSASQAATAALLRWSSMAYQASGAPLVAHRLHLPLRGPTGFSLCLNPACDGPEKLRRTGLGSLQEARGDRCSWCDSVALPVMRCEQCGHVLLASQLERGALRPLPLAELRESQKSLSARGMLLELSGNGLGGFEVRPDGTLASGGPRLHPIGPRDLAKDALPSNDCEHEWLQPLTTGPGLLLSVVAETALAAMPPERDHERESILPGGGRRLLVFSDSRREAARLGPALTWTHELQIVRAAILRLLAAETAEDADAVRDFLAEEIQRIQDSLAGELPSAVRERRQRDLGDRLVELNAIAAGGRVADWERKLADSEVLAQLLCWEGADAHRRDNWSKDTWERNRRTNRTRSRELLARELVAPSGRSAGTTLEALGLAAIDYPGLDNLPSPSLAAFPRSIRSELQDQWPALVAALLDSIRVDGGITSGAEEIDRDYSEDYAQIGKWVMYDGSERVDLLPFRGATSRHRRNRFLRQALFELGLSADDLDEYEPDLARAVFNWLREVNPLPAWLERHRTEAKFRLLFPELSLRKPADVHMNLASGRIVGRTIAQRHPLSPGRFVPRTQAQLDDDPRLKRRRQELLGEVALTVGLWAEEHSAQLDSREARRIQELFEAGARNVLSSSTTMELGVDIGGISGVLMTNTPPSRARYLQRAGRAGRRGEGASVTLSFARNRPFDQAVFRDFGRYLSEPLRAPSVLLERDLLALRHAYSHLLGSFFRTLRTMGERTGTMAAFGKMGGFMGSQSTARWRSGLKPLLRDYPSAPEPPKPLDWWQSDGSALAKQFGRYLDHLSAHPDGIADEVGVILKDARASVQLRDWSGFCAKVSERFNRAMQTWREEFQAFLDAWTETSERHQANFIHFQLEELNNRDVISFLAEHQFLPRFGFPLGVLQLRVDDRQSDSGWQLARSGALALREYAPGAKVLVGGRQVTSRGLVKTWVGQGEQALGALRVLLQCKSGHSYLATPVRSEDDCPFCGAPPAGSGGDVIEVSRGFRTAAWDPPRRARSAELVGETEVVPPGIEEDVSGASFNFDVPEVPGLEGRYLEGAELLTLNKGEEGHGFHICHRCGYAGAERKSAIRGRLELPAHAESHPPLWMNRRGRPCWRQGTVSSFARNQVLLHREATDLLVLDFRSCGIDLAADRMAARTWAAGLPHAIGETLNIDASDIASNLYPFRDGLGILLYDTASGGAGHVAKLQRGSLLLEVLTTLRQRLFVDEAHHARCLQGCLECVLSFGAQRLYGDGLNRPHGLALLAALLSGAPTLGARQSRAPSEREPRQEVSVPSSAERIARARERKRQRRK